MYIDIEGFEVINSDIGGFVGLMGYIWIVKIRGD